MDSFLARAFGYQRDNKFSRWWKAPGEDETREEAIRRVVDRLAAQIRGQLELIEKAREAAVTMVPDIAEVSTLRFCDIIIWTTQDDAA